MDPEQQLPSPREVKNAAIAQLAQAFSNPVRVALVGVLAQGEFSVDVLAGKVGQTRANTSAQLRALQGAEVVQSRREGRRVLYRLASPAIRRLFRGLQDAAASSQPSLRDLLRDYYEREDPGQPPLSEIVTQLSAGRAVLLDLRPPDEREQLPLPGAREIPAEALEAQLKRLPRRKRIYVVCRGPYCVLAAEGTRLLRASGRRVWNVFASPRELIEAGLGA